MSFGAQRKLHTKFKFLVYSDRYGSAAFAKCSALESEAAKIEYYEGGSLIPIKVPGRLTFSDITLEKGTSDSLEMYNWFQEVGNAVTNAGVLTPNYKTDDLSIIQQERDNSTAREWAVIGAWPMKATFMDGLDNGTDEIVIESVTLCIDYFYPKS